MLETESRSLLAWGYEWEQELSKNKHEETFGDVGSILNLFVMRVSQSYTFTENHEITYSG